MTTETFGRYQLIQLAGTGGMAQVHLARQVGPEGFVKPCVLKRIAPDQAGDPRVRRMFMEEARLTALLNHPNIVQTFDYGELEGVPYLAMELVDGVNLAQLCRTLRRHERWLPLGASVDIVLSLLNALEYAHHLRDLDGRPLNLVHRDVSPQNALLSRQGIAKLADFGIARHDAREAATIGTNIKGKPGYMSPEQAMGAEVDHRADLFSVGIILAELIGARRVLGKKDRVKGLMEVEARVRELCRVRSGVPPDLVEFTITMARFEPRARPQTAADAAKTLRQIRATIHEGPPLADFLRSVFHTYLNSAGDEAVQTVDKTSASAHPQPSKSPAQQSEGSAEAEWNASPPAAGEATGTAAEAVYGLGWPSQFLPEEPAGELDLVKNSSSVEAMQFFGAQFSDDLEKRSPEDGAYDLKEDAPARTRRQPYILGTRGPTGSSAGSSSTDLPPVSPDEIPPPHEPAEKKEILALSDPNLEQVLKTIDDGPKKRPAPRRFEIPPIAFLMVAGLTVVGIGIGILALAVREPTDAAPPAPQFGTLVVTSTPVGGRVLLDDRDVGRQTPAQIDRLPVDAPIRVAVQKRGHLASPPDVVVRIPSVGLRTAAHFVLRPGRGFRIESTPPEASVMLNGHRVADVTPVNLPVVPYGETATVSVALEGFMPAFVYLKSAPETAAVTHIRLEPGQRIEISSNPSGAEVRLDGIPQGKTPLYDILVPVDRRFTVKIHHPGFRRWRKRLLGGQVGEMIVADLKPLSFLSLPWSRTERKHARELARALQRERRNQGRLTRALKRAEVEQLRIESSLGASVGDLAEVQRRTDVARDLLFKSANEVAELESRMDSMRQVLLLRMESE